MKNTRKIIHTTLFVLTALIFLFSLFSGAEPRIQGLLINIPNTLPWLLLFLINIIAKYNEIIGGIILIALAIFLFDFFNIVSRNGWVTFFIILFPILILGIGLVTVGILEKKKN